MMTDNLKRAGIFGKSVYFFFMVYVLLGVFVDEL